MKKFILPVVLALISIVHLHAQDTYESTLKQYFEATGTYAAFKPAIQSIIGSFKAGNSNIPDEFWSEFEKELSSSSVTDLVKYMAPVYKKHLTEGDLREIINFYNTPAGKKLATKTPMLSSESMAAGQAWGKSIAEKVVAKLKEKGY